MQQLKIFQVRKIYQRKPNESTKLEFLEHMMDKLNCTSNSFIDNKNLEISKLSDYLKSQINIARIENKQVMGSIEININENSTYKNFQNKYFDVKTLRVNWNNNKNSFIQVLINTTTIKHYEMEKTKNECLQLMFSSISHEFRTPINAFSNSMLLIESNYNNLI